MNKLLIGIVVLLIVGIGVFVIMPKSNSTDNTSTNSNNNNADVKTFVIDGTNYKFNMSGVENPDIKVKEGDKVKIEFTNSEGFHDFVIDEFNAKTERINAGGKSSTEFTADKKGTFEYYCSVGQHRANGMKGKFIVE